MINRLFIFQNIWYDYSGDYMSMHYRRVIACFVDLFLVFTLSVMISRVSICNPYYEQYNTYAAKYNKIIQEGTEDFEKINLSKLISDAIPTLKKTEKYSFFYAFWYLMFFFLYFVVFQFFTGGQTLGKKILNLKVVNNSDKEEPVKFKQLLRRSFFIGSGLFRGVTFTIVLQMIINLLAIKSDDVYYVLFTAIGFIAFVYEIVFIFYYLFNKKHRGINDIIGGTKVIDLRR